MGKKLRRRNAVADSMKSAFKTPKEEPEEKEESEDSEEGFMDGLKNAMFGKSRSKLNKSKEKKK